MVHPLRSDVIQPARPAAATAETDEIDVMSLLGTIWRGKLFIAAVMLAMILVGGYYAYGVAVPSYRASAVVMLESRQEQVISLESVVGGLSADSSVVNTEVEVLQSRVLLGKVVDQLNLIEDPEFNLSLTEMPLIDKVKLQVRSWLGLVRPVADLSDEEQAARTRAATVSSLRQSLIVRNVPQSLVFVVTAQSTGPRKSAVIANTVVDLYIRNQLDVKFEATEKATAWLTSRVSELQVELEQAEARVKDFRANTDLISPETLVGLERQVKELRDRLQNLRSTQAEAIRQRDALRAAATPQEQAEVTGDPQLQRLLPRIEVDDIRRGFDDRVTQLLTRTEFEITRNESQIEALIQSQQELETQIDEQSDDSIVLQQLVREAEASRLLYEYFLTRLKETSAQQGIQQADSRILSRAEVPANPAAPRKSLILAASAFLGLVIGALLILLREMRQDNFRDPARLEAVTGYAVTGQIPMFKTRNYRKMVDDMIRKPTSAAVESVRNLRTSIVLSDMSNPPQVILICSSVPGEGKSTVAMALSMNFAGLNERVLLIEGDTRRRVLSEYLGGAQERGLSSILAGEATLPEVVQHDDRMGVDVLPAGKTDMQAVDRFAAAPFAEMLEEARTVYDRIIIDTPPVLVVPDARIIAQQADTVQFVVHWDSTKKDQVVQSLKMFESPGQPIIGLVLNKINPKGVRSYGYGAYYGRGYYQN